MREIEECTAEVFRRSERRIRERRRRYIRMGICCVPVLICLAVISAAILPGVKSGSKGDMNGTEMMMGIANPGCACAYDSVKIRNPATDDCRLITDKQNVDCIFFAILEMYGTTADEAVPEGNVYGFGDTEGTDSFTTVDLELTFQTKDGAESTYQLAGNTLFCVETCQRVELHAEQLAALQAVFGLLN